MKDNQAQANRGARHDKTSAAPCCPAVTLAAMFLVVPPTSWLLLGATVALAVALAGLSCAYLVLGFRAEARRLHHPERIHWPQSEPLPWEDTWP